MSKPLELLESESQSYKRRDPLHGWIKVSERLPRELGPTAPTVDSISLRDSVEVLAIYKSGEIWKARYGYFISEDDGSVDFGWWWQEDDCQEWCFVDNITHWREIELPEAQSGEAKS